MHQFSDEFMQKQEQEKDKDERHFIQVLESFYNKIFNTGDLRSEEEKILDMIKAAHDEWKNAEAFFQDVTDPDLIDHAIYRIQAAKTRYSYLIKLAREMEISQNFQ